jgi:hypothetical protein
MLRPDSSHPRSLAGVLLKQLHLPPIWRIDGEFRGERRGVGIVVQSPAIPTHEIRCRLRPEPPQCRSGALRIRKRVPVNSDIGWNRYFLMRRGGNGALRVGLDCPVGVDEMFLYSCEVGSGMG